MTYKYIRPEYVVSKQSAIGSITAGQLAPGTFFLSQDRVSVWLRGTKAVINLDNPNYTSAVDAPHFQDVQPLTVTFTPTTLELA